MMLVGTCHRRPPQCLQYGSDNVAGNRLDHNFTFRRHGFERRDWMTSRSRAVCAARRFISIPGTASVSKLVAGAIGLVHVRDIPVVPVHPRKMDLHPSAEARCSNAAIDIRLISPRRLFSSTNISSTQAVSPFERTEQGSGLLCPSNHRARY